MPRSWARLGEVTAENLPVDRDAARANVAHALTLGLPEINRLPEWGKFKRGEPIAIVAAGPSLRYTLAELAAFKVIMLAGSVHDFAVSHGVRPTYAVAVDPTPTVVASYFKRPVPRCNYLVASMYDRGVFQHLKEYPVPLWPCGGPPKTQRI